MNFIVGLDVGSHSIKAAVAEVKKNGKLSLVKVIKMPSAGMRRGLIDDLPEATRAISQVLSEVKKVSKNAVKNIYLGVGSPDFRVQHSQGIVAVSRADSEIYKDDIDRAVEASQAVKLPLNRMIVHSVTREFIVDDVADVRDPLGMVGNRLEVRSLIIDSFAPAIKNLTKCVESAGGGVAALIFSPLAACQAILNRNQKDLGVVLIDIGFGKTGVAIYEENKLLHTAVFPVGSGNVTNDLAIGLKTSVSSAENIKLTLGSAIAKEAPAREIVDLKKFDPGARGTTARRFISEIIEVRLAEVLEFVNNELKHISKSAKLPGGVIITGGGAKMPGMVDLAKQELRMSAQIGVPSILDFETSDPDLISQSEDPEMACALGLLLLGSEKMTEDKPFDGVGIFKKFFRMFLP
ncbi:MAG: cell division protein FtsA [Patescibacteria group bacterium]